MKDGQLFRLNLRSTALLGAAFLSVSSFGSKGAVAATRMTTPDGWGPFKFAMSMDLAEAASSGRSHSTAPDKLEYPCFISNRSFTAIVVFSQDRQRIRYINLVEDRANELSDKIISSEYTHFIGMLTYKYGDANHVEPPVSDLNKTIGHIGPVAVTRFDFSDGGSISVEEQVGWLPHLLIHYSASPPHEGL